MPKPIKRNLHELVNLKTAAEITGKSRQVVPAMVGRGELEGKTVAGRLFIYRASAERFAAMSAPPADKAA